MKNLYAWLTDKNWKTWAGHALWGVAVGLTVGQLDKILANYVDGLLRLTLSPSFWTVFGMFTLRELSDADEHGRKDRPEGSGITGYLTTAWRSFTSDGYFDLVTPFIGLGLVLVWQYAVGGLLLIGGGSVLVIFGHRLFKGRWIWEGVD